MASLGSGATRGSCTPLLSHTCPLSTVRFRSRSVPPYRSLPLGMMARCETRRRCLWVFELERPPCNRDAPCRGTSLSCLSGQAPSQSTCPQQPQTVPTPPPTSSSCVGRPAVILLRYLVHPRSCS